MSCRYLCHATTYCGCWPLEHKDQLNTKYRRILILIIKNIIITMLRPQALRACGAYTQCYLQGKPCLPNKNSCSDLPIRSALSRQAAPCAAPRIGRRRASRACRYIVGFRLRPRSRACPEGRRHAQALSSSAAVPSCSRISLKTLNYGN